MGPPQGRGGVKAGQPLRAEAHREVAATHAFSHIVRLDPEFNLDRLLDPIAEELIAPLTERVKKDATAFAGAFSPKVVDDVGGPAGAGGQGEGENAPGASDVLGQRGPATS